MRGHLTIIMLTFKIAYFIYILLVRWALFGEFGTWWNKYSFLEICNHLRIIQIWAFEIDSYPTIGNENKNSPQPIIVIFVLVVFYSAGYSDWRQLGSRGTWWSRHVSLQSWPRAGGRSVNTPLHYLQPNVNTALQCLCCLLYGFV